MAVWRSGVLICPDEFAIDLSKQAVIGRIASPEIFLKIIPLHH